MLFYICRDLNIGEAAMIFETSVGQIYFYILCKWVTIGFGIFCLTRIVEGIVELIRISRIMMGPCKALKNLEERIEKIEDKEVK